MEIWAKLKGELSCYQVSTLGNVKSTDRTVIYQNQLGKTVQSFIRGQPMKSYYCEGYLKVDLYHKSKRKKCFIHRLVAQQFIPNPLNLPEVNHLNGDRADSNVENLEWCTTSENIIHAFKYLGRKATVVRGDKSSLSKVVLQFDHDGKIISEYFSATEAARVNKYTRSRISECCLGKHPSAYGFIWRYKNDAV